jgi:hypothetical protein
MTRLQGESRFFAEPNFRIDILLHITTINQINHWKFQNMLNLSINNFQLVKNRAMRASAARSASGKILII